MLNQPNLNQQINQLAKSRVKAKLPILSLVGGVLVLVVGLGALAMSTLQTKKEQDTRSEASGTTSKVILRAQPQSAQVTVNQPTKFIFSLSPRTGPVANLDGLQLEIKLPKQYFAQPTAQNIALSNTANWQFALDYPEISLVGNDYLIKMMLLPWQPTTNTYSGGNLTIQPNTVLFDLYVTPLVVGQASLGITDQSMATAFASGDGQNLLDFDPQSGKLNVVAAQSGTPATLSFPFKLVGVSRANIEIPTKVWFTQLNADDTIKAGGQEVVKDVTFKSDTQGWLIPTTPVDISDLAANITQPRKYRVMVKTPVSLRKKLGTVELTAANQAIAITPTSATQHGWYTELIKVGDFVNGSENEFNKIRSNDVQMILQRWTQLRVDASRVALKPYDVNYDGVLNSIDVNLVISRWTEITMIGD